MGGYLPLVVLPNGGDLVDPVAGHAVHNKLCSGEKFLAQCAVIQLT